MQRPLPTTRWSLVLRAGGNRCDPLVRRSLEELCQSYWPPLYAHLRRRGLSAEDAEDRVQGFFTDLLSRDDLGRADASRGRFRAFLFASLDHFVCKQYRHDRAVVRGGQVTVVSLDQFAQRQSDAESLASYDVAVEDADPEKIFNRGWARWLVFQTLAQLRADYAARGKESWFDQLQPALTGQADTMDRQAVAQSLGMTATAVKVAIHRLRQEYRRRLVASVAETVDDPEEIGQERRFLFNALR